VLDPHENYGIRDKDYYENKVDAKTEKLMQFYSSKYLDKILEDKKAKLTDE